MNLKEAFEKAAQEPREGLDRYRRTFELLHSRLPSDDERAMIKRRCLWYESAEVGEP